MRDKNDVLNEVVEFAQNNSNIKAVLLTSSMANPTAETDILSDLDIVFVMENPSLFIQDKSWRYQFGKVMTFFNDEFKLENYKTYTCLVLYKDYIRIDFSIWPVELINEIADKDRLPDYLDIGYKVLVDKTNICGNLKHPTYKGFNVNKPTEKQYFKNINDFWWDIVYIPKYLWRDQFYFAKYMDYFIKFNIVQEMVEWLIGSENNWNVNCGKCGSKFKNYLKNNKWDELKNTFSGGNIKDNWESIFKMISFYRKIAVKVGDNLDYKYPHQKDKEVTNLIKKIYNSEPPFQK